MSHWLVIPNYDGHPSNSLQYIKQNHWTVKCKSRSPWPHNTQVNVIRSSDVWPTMSINYLHNRKAEMKNAYQMCPRFWPLAPPQGMDPGYRSYGMKADPPGYLCSKYECFLKTVASYDLLKNLEIKLYHSVTWTRPTMVTTIALVVLGTGELKILNSNGRWYFDIK